MQPKRATAGAGMWRRTPPAVFPPLLGLLGLGLGWRAWFGTAALPGPGPGAGLAEAFLGAVSLVYALALVAWLSKPLRRPGVVFDEARTVPGVAGMAAATMGAMLLALVLLPYAPGLAMAVAVAALAGHLGQALLFVHRLATGPAESRPPAPVWHLVFVGFVLAPLPLVPMGLEAAGRAILYASIVAAVPIWALGLRQFLAAPPPAPLRPLLAIHLAPACLFVQVGVLTGLSGPAQGFGMLAVILFAAFVARARWLTAAGFSAMWGAFTFPLAAFAAALLALSRSVLDLEAPVIRTAAAVALVVATLAILPIGWRILRLWSRGSLAEATNAATA